MINSLLGVHGNYLFNISTDMVGTMVGDTVGRRSYTVPLSSKPPGKAINDPLQQSQPYAHQRA